MFKNAKVDSGRARARSMVEPGVMALNRQNADMTPPGNAQAVSVKRAQSQLEGMNPRPGFANGGAVKLPGLKAPRKATVPNLEERTERPGGMKKGGAVNDDEAADKKLVKKMINKAEAKEKPGMKDGGKAKGFAVGGAAKVRKGQATADGTPKKAVDCEPVKF